MSDNFTITQGTGTTIGADDVSGVMHQRVKISQGVDGSATDVSSTDPLNVTLANTGANATAIKVDGSSVTQPVSGTFWQATQPVSAASLPLPSGASTAAKQPALGTAGTASADVISVQGIASMTPISSNLYMGGSVVSTSNPVPIQPPASGALAVSQSTATNLKTQAECYQGGSAVASGNPLQVTLANTGANSTAVKVDGSAVTQPVSGNVTPVPATSGGLLVAMMSSADGSTALTNTAQAIKASAGQLFGYYIYNPNSSATYVLVYNTAAGSVTVGTTNPLMCFCIPPTSGANCSFEHGIAFSNAGWSAAAATTGGGNTAPSTALEAMFFYK